MQTEAKWEQYASCRNWPIKLEDGTILDPFFEGYEEYPHLRRSVEEMCQLCPVREVCEIAGPDNKWGIWGGKWFEDGEVVELE